MRAARHLWSITRSFVALAALASACSDDDRTDVCLGPGCTTYRGIAGRNSLTAGGLGPEDAGSDEPPDASRGTGGSSAVGTDAGPQPLEPCEVAFVVPIGNDAGALTLESRDDVDGEACGLTFSAHVVLQSTASTVNLFVNDNPLGAALVSDGRATYDAALSNRGQTGNGLRAEATMADGRRCSAVFEGTVFVACPGPSCSIDDPRATPGGFLNESQDSDPDSSGLQADIVVLTEAQHAGQNVRLEVDDNFEAVPSSPVVASAGEGRATFPVVTLAEGVRAVRAECRDAFDIVTLSPVTEWNVDVSSCSIEIESIASGADPITPADDLDSNAGNGLDVLVRGTIEGDDCDSFQLGECGDELADIRSRGLLGDDGGLIVPIKLDAQTARLTLCARVTDAAGNQSPEVEVEVEVRADSPSVAITAPAPSTRYNLAGTSGAVSDGNPASAGSCEIDVVVSCTDVGVGVELLADDDVLATQPCVAQSGLDAPFLGQATFSGVSLTSQDDGATTPLSARQSVPGLPAGTSASVLVQADCNRPSCSFDSPEPSTPLLNATLDGSSDPGFQIDFVVATDAESAGLPLQLVFNGDTDAALNMAATAGGGGASATFAGVTLSEAAHDVQALCADAAGNVQQTAVTTWTVDLTACTTNLLVAAGHDPVVPNDDQDGSTGGLQVSVVGQTSGASCSAARVGLCGSMSGAFTDLEPDGSFELEATLASAAAAAVSVCAEVRDEAGNVSSASALVNVRVDAPVVAFLAPAAAATFNIQDGGCDTIAVVSCSENGAPVELFADGQSQGTQSCTGNEASFAVALATKNDGTTTVLSAQQTAGNVSSALATVSVQADCQAPALSFAQPTCSTQLGLAGDDANPGATGFQLDVNVVNGGVPDVVLTVTSSGSTDIPATGNGTSTDFADIDLGGAGNVSLVACATDAQGNEGCAPSCALSIVAEPSIAITNPRPPALFTIEDDCSTGTGGLPGLQIVVEGTSDAADGSPVEIAVGSGTASTALLGGGGFIACVAAPDGDNQTLRATVTDTGTGLASTASVIVSTNASVPAAIAAPTFAVTGRRQGTVSLTWLSVLDASSDPLVAYHLRCSRTDITTESIWDAATIFPVSVTPSAVAGTSQTQGVSNFRTGTERFCMVRGQDAFGQLSPLTEQAAPTVSLATLVSNPFLELDYSPVTPTAVIGTRVSVVAVGDINGDGQNDFVYGTQNGGAQVFFGGTDLDPTPDVSIPGPTAQTPFNHEFGANVSGLGDINGDGRPDFAITARVLSQPAAALGGSVFIFFGRASTADWDALAPIALSASPGCGADLCFHSSEASAALGSSVTSTDFDGDGEPDLIIGANNRTADDATLRVGRVYVVLGGSQLALLGTGTTATLPGAALNGFIISPPTTTGTRNFGINVASVGTGADALGDLVISATGRNAGGELINAEAFSVLGRTHGGGGALLAVSAGPSFAVGPPNAFGNPMRAVGDVNADGFGDVWVSANFELNGVCPVFLGRSTGFSSVSLFGFTNNVVDNDWGTYVATGFHTELGRLGDLDGNGFDDLLVGAPFANGAPGTTELFYSDATTQNRARSAADAAFDSSGNGQLTPGFVGDISGDGFRDIAILDSGASLPATRLTLYY